MPWSDPAETCTKSLPEGVPVTWPKEANPQAWMDWACRGWARRLLSPSASAIRRGEADRFFNGFYGGLSLGTRHGACLQTKGREPRAPTATKVESSHQIVKKDGPAVQGAAPSPWSVPYRGSKESGVEAACMASSLSATVTSNAEYSP